MSGAQTGRGQPCLTLPASCWLVPHTVHHAKALQNKLNQTTAARFKIQQSGAADGDAQRAECTWTEGGIPRGHQKHIPSQAPGEKKQRSYLQTCQELSHSN